VSRRNSVSWPDLADAAFRANLRNISADPAAVRVHDELLARSCVFGYLYDRHFLHSAELLLNELRWLRAMRRPEAPSHSIHPLRFEEHRDAQLDMLIRRFQGVLDYPRLPGRGRARARAGAAPDPRRTAEFPALDESVRQSTEAKTRSD
jgi:hypothetical protein